MSDHSDAGASAGDKLPTAFERKIVKQIEYYFGDKNLPRDKFLLQQVEEDKGWVTIDCMLTFNRLKTLVEEAVGNSLRKYGSGLLEVDVNNKKLRRLKPMPEDTEETCSLAKEKTIYCKGFPADATLDNIEEFFEDKGKCIFIKMRRNIDEAKTFKGSVFVEFDTKEEAATFLATKGLKYGDTELLYMFKDAYFRSKKEGKGKHCEVKAESENKERPKQEEKTKTIEYENGRVIHLSGFGEQTSREDIKELFSIEGISTLWVDFDRGDKEGYVRFAKAGDGEKAINAAKEANDNKVRLRGVETTLRVIEGEEEKNYWIKVSEAKEKLRRSGGKKYRGNQKRGRQQRYGTPHKDNKSDEPPAKQPKTED